MGWWDYKNVGAAAKPEHKKYVEKIFEYIGYASEPANTAADYDECSFRDPEVYGCETSAYDEQSGHLNECFTGFDETDLLSILNSLFPQTWVYVHWTSGTTVTDTYEFHDRVYNTSNMTLQCMDSYKDYGGFGPNEKKAWRERFSLNAPKMGYVVKLIDLSAKDGNAELTALLLDLSQRLRAGLVIFKDAVGDSREIGKPYDIQEGDQVKWWMVADGGYDEAIRNASANLDNDADISFFDKHFVLSGFDDVEETIITKIEMRGGYVHDKMVKKADYLVICMETPGSAKLKQALLWRESGSPCLIVSNHQLDQAFDRIPPVDPETLRQRDEERIIQAREKKNDTRKTAMERKQQREDARRRRFEEKQRQVEEARMLREETRRQKYEAKQNEAGKHRRQLSMKSEDEPVDNAGNASVIAQSEIKNSSPSDAKPQQPTALDQPELAEKAPEDRAYYGDHTLSRVIIPEGCESIGNGTFGMSSLTDIQIPSSVRSIGSMAFCGLLKIGAITIPEGVRALGNMVFSGSNSLKSVVLPASLESVGKDIFYGCESLEKVTMPHVTFDRFKDEAWLQAIEGIIEIVPSAESDTEESISKKTTAETDEDSWIQAIAAEASLQDEEVLYLRTIHQLFQSAETVRMIDVAKRLEQGTGKVSYWMKKLREKGVLDTTPKGVITMLKPAQSKKDETKEEATEDGSVASVGSAEREDDFVVSSDDVDGADDTGEELETPHEATESVQEGNGLEPEAQEQPIEEEPDAIPEGQDSRSQRRRERPTEKLLEAIEEIRRRYPEGASEADMKALKQKNPDIPWQILAGNAKRVLGKPLVPYLEDIGILRKENADRQVAVEAEPENDERVQRETEERAEREAEERARREAEEQAQREAEEQARREAIEAARQEKIRSIKSQIDDLKAEMNAAKGLLGAFKRKKIQAAIDELTDQLNKME